MMTHLLLTLGAHHPPDHDNKLLLALKERTLSSSGHKCSSEEIVDLKPADCFKIGPQSICGRSFIPPK